LSEHAVIVHYALSGDGFGGDEFGAGEAITYLYGADADHLYRAIEVSVRRVALRPAYAVLRYGDADDPAAEERRIEL
jgi:hypothetical protein